MVETGNSGRLCRGLFRFWRGEYTESRSWIGIRSPSKAETLVGFALDQALGPGMTINPPWKSTGNRFCSNEFRHKRGGLFPKFLHADPGSSAAKPEVEKSSPPTARDCSCIAAGESLKSWSTTDSWSTTQARHRPRLWFFILRLFIGVRDALIPY